MQENQNPSQSESVSSDTPSPATKTGSDKVSRKSQRKISRSSKSEVLATRKRTNPLVWLLILVNTLVVAALCSGAFYAWMQWQSLQASHAEREASLKQEVAASVDQQLSDVIASSSADMAALEKKLTSQLALSGAQLQDMAQQIEGLQSATATDWDLAELRYLVNMAQYKVMIEYDLSAAIMALREVDAMLSHDGDLQYLPLREAIAADLQQLIAIDSDAQVRLLISTTALVSSSSQLVFPKPKDFYHPEEQQVSDDASDWWRNLKINISNLLMIDYDFELEEAITPFLSQQQQDLIQSALQSNLLTARYAIIKQENELFIASLKAASDLLSQFESNQFRTQFQQSIEQLNASEFPVKLNIVLASAKYLATEDNTATDNHDDDNNQEL